MAPDDQTWDISESTAIDGFPSLQNNQDLDGRVCFVSGSHGIHFGWKTIGTCLHRAKQASGACEALFRTGEKMSEASIFDATI